MTRPPDFSHLLGVRFDGGCDDCAADQELERGPADGIWIVHTYHDDGCPTLARHQRAAKRSRP